MLEGEEKLIRDAALGNAPAFGLLYDHYQQVIYRFVAVKVGRREEAEDITHQVFINAWQNIGNYRHRGYPFSSWLYRIARNQVIDYYRSRRETVSIENIDIFDEPALAKSAQSELAKKIDLEKVAIAMKQLKQEYQDVIIFRFIEDLSIKETASAMKKSEGAVKLMQHRAIKEVRKVLGEEEM